MNKLDKYKIQSSNKDILEFVSAIITNKQGNVLVLKRRNDLELDPGKYDMCSGHMKKGEVSIFSMLRELKEEIGIKQEEINSLRSIGTIPTPHKKFPDTKCHMYHVIINFSEKELNKRIKQVPEPEMEEAIFLEDLDVLRDLQKNSNLFRTEYNENMEKMLKIVEEIIEQRSLKEEKCEER